MIARSVYPILLAGVIGVAAGPMGAAPARTESSPPLPVVENVAAELQAVSPNARSLYNSPRADLANRWLDLQMFNAQPLQKTLSGLELEYRIVQLYSRDRGKREAKISFNVGQGTQDIGFRNDVDLLLDCRPSNDITLR